jgi:hypothetical protein
MDMNAYEQFCYCTTRIESVNTNTSTISVGTGFFFTFTTKNGNHKVLLITNKHNRSVEGVLKMGNGLVVSNLKPIVDIPNNIGYAIKSDCIKDVICLVEKNELEKGTFVSNIK